MQKMVKILVWAGLLFLLLAVLALPNPEGSRVAARGITETFTPEAATPTATLPVDPPDPPHTPTPELPPAASPTPSPAPTQPGSTATPTRQAPPPTPEELPVTGFGRGWGLEQELEAAPARQSPAGAPLARLRIPRLEVDRPVVLAPVQDGQWNLARLGQNVGLLEGAGARPGDDLALALAGHVQVPGFSGPFYGLATLQPGDEIVYELEGLEYVYHVVELVTVRPEEVARLFVPDGNRLLLVTCVDWDESVGLYTRRLIVDAELE